MIDGNVRPGRYNRPGERALYMSASPEGVAAAMQRYDGASRTLIRLRVDAARLVDLRDPDGCARWGVDSSGAKQDWIAAIDRGHTPQSWLVSDRVRAVAAAGLIDRSRHEPWTWHLVLFRWNVADAPEVAMVERGGAGARE